MQYYFDKKVISFRGSELIKPTETCPIYKHIMIGSTSCCMCKYNEENTDDYIICKKLNKK